MPNKFIFADEAGCFTFKRANNVSRYFILCTVIMDDCAIANQLLALRRQLAWDGHELGDYFHASEDKQVVRDAFFNVIKDHPFSVQATIMEKSKAQSQVRRDKPRFYKTGYYFHFRHGTAAELAQGTEALVTTASLGTRRERAAFQSAVDDVLQQTQRSGAWRTDFLPCQADPCLQVADYCAWAIQKKWERGDVRSYDIIKNRVTYEYDLWAHGATHYY